MVLRLVVAALLLILSTQYASRLECSDDSNTRLAIGRDVMGLVKPAINDSMSKYTRVSVMVNGNNVTVCLREGLQFVARAFGHGASLSAPVFPWNYSKPYLTHTDGKDPGQKCANQLYLEVPLKTSPMTMDYPARACFWFRLTNATKVVVGYSLGQAYGVYLVEEHIVQAASPSTPS